MLYWLFSDGRDFLGAVLIPVLCLTPVLLIAASLIWARAFAGRETNAAAYNGIQRFILLSTYAVVLLALMALFVVLLGDLAVQPARGRRVTNPLILLVTSAPPSIDVLRLFLFGLLLVLADAVALFGLHSALHDGGWLRERVDRLRRPPVTRGALGSAHFCTPREFRRFRHTDPDGLTLLGAFWGADRRRLDFGAGRFGMSGEDAARGLLALGGPGSGKTQGVILPTIADRMQAGHSLIVADPQGELLPLNSSTNCSASCSCSGSASADRVERRCPQRSLSPNSALSSAPNTALRSCAR